MLFRSLVTLQHARASTNALVASGGGASCVKLCSNALVERVHACTQPQCVHFVVCGHQVELHKRQMAAARQSFAAALVRLVRTPSKGCESVVNRLRRRRSTRDFSRQEHNKRTLKLSKSDQISFYPQETTSKRRWPMSLTGLQEDLARHADLHSHHDKHSRPG